MSAERRDTMTSTSSPDIMVPVMCGRVTHVMDPTDFWLRMGSDADLASFDEFELKLNPSHRRLQVGRTDGVVEGCMVLVYHTCPDDPDARQWRRATVIRVDRVKNAFDVHYIDFGNTEIVPSSAICQTIPEEVGVYPVTVYRCALAGIQSIATSWTSRGVKTFEKLTLKKTLKVALVSYDHLTFSHRVALYQSVKEEKSITHLMLEAETGLPTDEEVKEFVKDVVPVSFQDLYGCQAFYDEDYSQTTGGEALEMNAESCASGQSTATEGTDQVMSPSSSNASPDPAAERMEGRDGPDSDRDQRQEADVQGTRRKLVMPSGVSQESHSSGEEDSGEEDSGEEEGESPTQVVVPGFNLTVLQKRPMLSAPELQREQEEALKAERKARLQKDLIACHRDLDQINMSSGQGQHWEKSDLLIGRQVSEDMELASISAAVAGISAAAGPGDGGKCVALQEACDHVTGNDNSQTHVAEAEEEAEIMPSVTADRSHDKCDSSVNTTPAEDREPSVHALPSEHSMTSDTSGSSTCLSERGYIPPPPQGEMTVEEEEYNRQKQFIEILQEGVFTEDWNLVCVTFHSLVPLYSDPEEDKLMFLMQVLIEEAVKESNITDLAVRVISSYSSVLSGEDLMEVLHDTCKQFVKLPVAKMPELHTRFAVLLTKLLFLSFDWPVILKNVTEDFILGCLEKWIIFNRKGAQTGLIQRKLGDMYIECVGAVLPLCTDVLEAAAPQQYRELLDEMKARVLETSVHHQTRSKLLSLLMRLGDPRSDRRRGGRGTSPAGGECRGASNERGPADAQRSHTTRDQAVQSDLPPPSFPSPPSSHTLASLPPDGDRQAERAVVGVDSACQTETTEKPGALDLKDVGAQTDWVGELPTFSRRASVSSMDDSSKGDCTPGSGRARRRKAVTEHLLKTEADRNVLGASPDPKLLLSFAAGRLSQEMGARSPTDTSDKSLSGGDKMVSQTGLQTLRNISGARLFSGIIEESELSQEIVKTQVEECKEVPDSKKEDGRATTSGVVPAAETAQCVDRNTAKTALCVDRIEAETASCVDGSDVSHSHRGSPDNSSSFFSAVSSISKSAWKSVFGSETDQSSFETSKADFVGDVSCASSVSEVRKSSSSSSVEMLPAERAVVGEASPSSGQQPTFPGVPSGLKEKVLASQQLSADTLKAAKTFLQDVTKGTHWDMEDSDQRCDASRNGGGQKKWIESGEGGGCESQVAGEEEESEVANYFDGAASSAGAPPCVDSAGGGPMDATFPLMSRPLLTTARTVTPPALTQLSLQSIASSLLEETPPQVAAAGDGPAQGDAKGRKTKGKGKDQESIDEKKGTRRKKDGIDAWKEPCSESRPKSQVRPVSCEGGDPFLEDELYCSNDEDGNLSVPSDWEDRASSPSVASGSGLADRDSSGDAHCTSQRPFENWQSGSEGAGSETETQAQSRSPLPNSCASKSKAPLPWQEASWSKEQFAGYSGSQHIDSQSHTTPLPPGFSESDIIPLRGLSLPSSSGDFKHGGESYKGNGSRPEESFDCSGGELDKSVSSESNSPCTGGDLGFMAKPGKKKKKLNFRPFEQMMPVARAPSEPREKWVPTNFICTNCNSRSHTRTDCPEPMRSAMRN